MGFRDGRHRGTFLTAVYFTLRWANESCAKKILTTRNPFPDLHTFVAILSVVIKGKRPKRPDMQECCDGLWNLLNQCWKDEPGDRPTTVKVLREVDKLAQSQGAF